MELIKKGWANKTDLKLYEKINEKLGYNSKDYNNCLSWSRQWEYGWVKEFLDKLPNDLSLLDVGVTPEERMNVLLENKKFIIYSCDLNKVKGNGIFTECNIKNNPYKTEQFDIVMSISTIEHDKEPIKCLKEMIRILKFNGYLIITIDYGLEGGWPLSDKNFREFLSVVNLKFENMPIDIIKSEEICNVSGKLRVYGFIIKK